MQLPEAAKRAGYTFVQAFVGTLALLAIPALTDIVRAAASLEPYELDFQFWQSVVVASCASGAIALLSFLVNYLAQAGHVPPSSGVNPVPDPTGPATNVL
jgi:hypothetical protein